MKTMRGRGRRFALVAGAAVVATSLVASGSAIALTAASGSHRLDGDQTQDVRRAIVGGTAKNVILLIGDGMGDSEITIARNYAYGAAGELPGIDALPLTGSYTTYSLYKDGANKGKPDYVPDSAATGTAWATGSKTYDNAVSVDIDGTALPTILEIAKANGLRTGNVSTAEIQDATPAVQVAHVGARSCYGPDSATCGTDALAAGGLGSISEQLLGTRPDVVLGGGLASFTQTAKAGQWSGSTLLEQADARGYQVVTDAAGLASVTKANQTQPLLGLFSDGNFPTRFAPTTATVGGANTPTTCTENPDRLESSLDLASLTETSIDLLSKKSRSAKDGKGFFLQVEGASIDKRDHSADACGQIGETIDLDEAVQVALDFAKKDRNTLVIVTADHAHTSQIVDSTPPTSLSTALTTVDGTVMKISYGTAAAGGSQQHTGSQVRIAAFGPGAANVVGLTDQTDTFGTITGTLDLQLDTAKLSKRAQVSSTYAKPGAPVTVKATGFAGDRQAVVQFGSESKTVDVIDGTVTAQFTAPTPKKQETVKVTVTGVQTEVAKKGTVTVR
ncbi:alkaline phosphatase [Microbacterium terricola]|uniref:Alkaline phosphatase n=1 Tax=Microbacterium terricola TaxID=344163 RepID=A0ABM8E343_9MICO|nr:alkaline phosphatase [Microbacterium terricola]UYK39923.1 alkaline phosphatase [Microbacterium terricola]BDV32398.1 alkaline phosphatase [Microbacterium terricola]